VANVALATANIANYDRVRSQAPQDIDVDWYCFTDSGEVPEPWRPKVVVPENGHPNLRAKRFKLIPPLPHRYVLWVDANIEITSSSFAREALACIRNGVALYKHPRRSCIYEEAEASLGSEGQNGRYAHLPIRAQVDHYRKEGHPEHGGLYACGVIAWDREHDRALVLRAQWLDECRRWGYQDQLSFPVVARRLGIEPGVFPHPQIVRYRPLMTNPWLAIHSHL
jgi:hypothetical protein